MPATRKPHHSLYSKYSFGLGLTILHQFFLPLWGKNKKSTDLGAFLLFVCSALCFPIPWEINKICRGRPPGRPDLRRAPVEITSVGFSYGISLPLCGSLPFLNPSVKPLACQLPLGKGACLGRCGSTHLRQVGLL